VLLRSFSSFHFGLSFITRFIEGNLIFFILIFFYLNWKRGWCIGGIHAFLAMRVALSGSKKKNFTMSLKTSPHLIPVGATCVSGGGVIYHRWTFFPLLFFLIPWKSQVCPLCCWYFNFSVYYFIFFFLIFL